MLTTPATSFTAYLDDQPIGCAFETRDGDWKVICNSPSFVGFCPSFERALQWFVELGATRFDCGEES